MGGTFAAAEKPLHDVIDHSGDPTLATKASALLMNNLAATRRYEDAFKLAQPLTIDLPYPGPDGPPPGAGEEAQPCLPDIGRPGSLQAGQRYPRPRHGPTPRTAAWSKPEAPGFGDDGSTCAKACSRPVLSSWSFRKSAPCRCLCQTRRIHRCHDTSGCSPAQRRHLPETETAARCGRARRARAAGI